MLNFCCFFEARNLKNRVFASTGAQFLRFRVLGTCLANGLKMHAKIDGFCIRKWRKIDARTLGKTCFFLYGFFINFGIILEGFGLPNGGQDGPKMGKLVVKKTT